MQKRSVRRKSFVLSLVIAAVAASGLFPTATTATLDPATLPLIQEGDIFYLGGFRLPRQTVNDTSYSFGGKALAFNPASNSLYVSSRNNQVAEVTIPTPLNSADANALPYASFLQPFADPTEGHLSEVGPDGVSLAALMVHGDRLYATGSVYYDALNQQKISHFSHSLQLNEPSFSGWTRVWDAGKTGLVAGYMSEVPSEWQPLLGGPAVTGQCCIPIVTRTSWGPAAFAFNPSQVGQATTAATPLLYYNDAHPTLGQWSASNATYGSSTEMGGMQIIPGTRTALYFGRNGMGPNCYGSGVADPSLAGTPDPEGGVYCYDPTDSSKGTHGYPYRYQVWAYDLNELAAVKAGSKQPWDVTPYGVWELKLPTPEPSTKLGGVAYDAERRILYVSQMSADRDGYEFRAVIHALELNVSPVAADSAPPAPSAAVSAVSLVANKTAPQVTNTPVTFTATPAGGAGPHQYKWQVNDGNGWAPVGDWTTSSQFVWTPATANQNYFVGLAVRSAGNTAADAAEATASTPFPIAAPAILRVSALTLMSDKTAPQAANVPVTFTATPTGGSGPHLYQWLVNDGNGWVPAGTWTTARQFVWTPATAKEYFVGVRVRSAGTTADTEEASASTPFAITAAVILRVSSVTLVADKAAPQAAKVPVTFTATPTGGSGPHQYEWLVNDGNGWVPVGTWTTSRQFVWTPATAHEYFVGVRVRSAGSTAGEEASASMPFAIK